MRLAIMVIAGIIGVWFSFDGTRALVAGDYVTARTGPHAGQLGPWARLVAAAGIAPRGQPMKIAHVVLGVAWLAALAAFVMRAPAAPAALGTCAVLSLWYLPIGTVLGLAELALLALARGRQ